MTDLDELSVLVAALTDGIQPGPFHAMESGDKSAYSWWLDTDTGDSSFPTPDDVALMVNALPTLIAEARNPRLDAERLAVALKRADTTQGLTGYREWAADIAREYAGLAAPPEDQPRDR